MRIKCLTPFYGKLISFWGFFAQTTVFNFTSYHFLCSYVKQSGRRFFRVHTFTWKDKKKNTQ